MKKMKKGIFLATLILLSYFTFSWAGDSFTFSISCTIPEIPGVNAPPFEEEQSAQSSVKQNTYSSMIQEEKQEDTKLVMTIYSR